MRPPRLPFVVVPCLLAVGLLLAGCAAPGSPGTTATTENFNDPLEDTNRTIFGFNQAVDQNVILPVAKAYRTVLPTPVRQSVHDVLQNMNSPVIFAHDVLQAQPKLAVDTLGRFVINSTIGIGGILDVATQAGIPYHPNDLGITLATWGIGEGPYVMIPILGPSNPRDIVGQIGDGFADPWNIVAGQNHLYWAVAARTVTSGVDERSRNIDTLAEIERTSLDYYATIRSLYRQRREAQIKHEQSNLPNPTPVQGSDSTAPSPISYSLPQVLTPPGAAPATTPVVPPK